MRLRTVVAIYVFLLAILLTLFAVPARAQNGLYTPEATPGFDTYARPPIEQDGPTAMIDEYAPLPPMTQIEYSARAWLEAKQCLAKNAVPFDPEMAPPPLFVVDSSARRLAVRDFTLDSLDKKANGFSQVTEAYTMQHSHRVVVVARYAHNIPLLRHEAIHWILWHASWDRQDETFGHPPEWFGPCDRYYDERKASEN